MRLQLTRVEELDRQKPELKLELAVRRMLRLGDTLQEIREFIRTQTGETLPLQTISNYKQQRWLAEKRRIEAKKERCEAIIALLGEHGVSEVTQAGIYEQVDEAMRAGAELNPHFLLREQRLWAQHEARLKQLENEKQHLANENARLAQVEGEKKAKVQKAIEDGEKDPQRTIERIREIYGLGAA